MITPSFRNFYDNSITRVEVKPPAWRLDGRGIFFMGSCFADYLYREYEAAGLNAMTSPFGNIYNPESLSVAAAMLAGSGEEIKPEDCFSGGGTDGRYRHFMFHSLVRGDTAEALAVDLNDRVTAAGEYIKTAEAAIITLGTSFVYRLKTGRTVNNCHRLPSDSFDRVQLTPKEAEATVRNTVNSLRGLNPELKIVITLSPVRHLRDNGAENSLSKAVLRCAAAGVCGTGPSDPWYFPSYEIMLDELRDYRWYADDLCHPSAQAVAYIISRFTDSAYNKEFREFILEYGKVLGELNHRPLDPESEEYKKFRKAAEKKKSGLKKTFPRMFGSLS